MSNSNPAPFKPGEQVVRRIRGRKAFGAAFTIHIVHWNGYEWELLDKHLNRFKARDCVLTITYQSPLWESMQEVEE